APLIGVAFLGGIKVWEMFVFEDVYLVRETSLSLLRVTSTLSPKITSMLLHDVRWLLPVVRRECMRLISSTANKPLMALSCIYYFGVIALWHSVWPPSA